MKKANSKFPLHEACKNGNFERVKHLVQSGHNVNLKMPHEGLMLGLAPPLFFAAKNDHSEIVRYLIKHGAKLYIRSGYTSFNVFYYLKAEDKEWAFKVVCNVFYYLKAEDKEWAFKVVCMSRTMTDELQTTLLHNMLMSDTEGNTIIHYAASRCEYKAIAHILSYNERHFDKISLDVEARNKFNMTALHLACRSDGDGTSKNYQAKRLKLTSYGPKIEYFTPTFDALLQTIKILLLEYANLNVKDVYGKTPLDYSKRIPNKQVLLSKVIELEDYEFLKKLFDRKIRDENGNTLLHHACMQSNYNAIKYLIGLKSNVNQRNNQQQTPIFLLHKNINKDDTNINFTAIKYLLKNQAKIYCIDINYKNILCYEFSRLIELKRDLKIVDLKYLTLFLEHGAKIEDSLFEGLAFKDIRFLLKYLEKKQFVYCIQTHGTTSFYFALRADYFLDSVYTIDAYLTFYVIGAYNREMERDDKIEQSRLRN